MISFGFIITSLIMVLIPGTGVIYTVSHGISGSKKDTIFAALGCTLGIVPHLIAGSLGLSALLHTSSIFFKVVKIIGILYLIYLGISMIRDKGRLTVKEKPYEKSGFRIILKAILINLLNPKLTLFFLSFLPQFIVNENGGYLRQLVFLSGFFMALTLIVFIMYGMLANYFKRLICKSPLITRRIQQAFGAVFIGLAAKLALSDD